TKVRGTSAAKAGGAATNATSRNGANDDGGQRFAIQPSTTLFTTLLHRRMSALRHDDDAAHPRESPGHSVHRRAILLRSAGRPRETARANLPGRGLQDTGLVRAAAPGGAPLERIQLSVRQ